MQIQRYPHLGRSLSASLLSFLLGGCLLMEGGTEFPGNDAPVGFAKLRLSLQKSESVLAKSAADSTFELDSLVTVFTAPGASDIRIAQPISGRPDTGAIALSPTFVELPGLRNWTARFYTIDERLNPPRRDTVHIDSVVFAVRPSDTSLVYKTISPAFSILRARFMSYLADSLPNNVLWLRLKVDGVVRDSLSIGGSDASLNWLQAMSGNTIHAVGDAGRVLKTTNNGTDWAEQVLTTQKLVGGHFVDASNGYVVSQTGQTYATVNGGDVWTTRATTADSLNGAYFTGTTTGFAIGRNGGLYKTENSANTWFTQVSNTTRTLNGISFPSASVGYVVGENETILRTVNGTAAAGSAPEFGGVVWTPVAGGWFNQTSNTSSHITSIKFTSPTTGWVVGAGGYVRLTTNGGSTWLERGGLNVTNPNAQWFTTATSGYTVGNGGEISQYINEWYWAPRTSGTAQNLHDVRFVGVDTGYVVGDNGTVRRTVNGSTLAWPYVIWSAQTFPNSASLRSVFTVTAATAFVAGASGTIAKTTNAGGLWSLQTSGTAQDLNGIAFQNANTGWAVGNAGTILKTTNGGSSWSAQVSGSVQDLHSIQVISADTAYVSGKAGVMLKTVNGGTTWYSQETPVAQQLSRVYFYNSGLGFAVGANGTILNAVNQGDNWTGGGVKRSLKGVHFASVDVGWIVGADGVILKTTNGGSTWAQQTSNTTVTLYGVYFRNASIGWVTGENGLILKTTNGGTTWTPQTSNTSVTLRWVNFRNNNSGFVIGGTQSMLATTNGGTAWTSTFVGVLGARTFDEILTYKYLRPGQPHVILMEAMDRTSPLRGYQSTLALTIGAGIDSTLLSPMTRCGYGGPTCTP